MVRTNLSELRCLGRRNRCLLLVCQKIGATPRIAAQITSVSFGIAPEFDGWHATVLGALRQRYARLVGVPLADSDAVLKEIPVRFTTRRKMQKKTR